MTDDKLDICFVAPYGYRYLDPENDDPTGGAQRQQYLLATELRDRGYDVGFIVEDVGQPTEQYIDGMLVRTGCPTDVSPLTLPGKTLGILRAIWEMEANTYYVRGAPRITIATALGCAVFRRRFIFCVANDADVERVHLNQRYGLPIRAAYLWALKSADAVIAQSDYQQKVLEENFDLASEVIPNGYSLPDESAVLPAKEREFVLWVGSSDEEQKRPELFLELAEQLPTLDFVMVSMPTHDDDGYHQELTRKAGNVPNVEFIGGVPPDEIHEYYRRAQLLVNTSAYEGFPNTFLEAWRFATPVVSLSFDLDGTLKNEAVGTLAGSSDQLVTEVQILVGDTNQRGNLGDNGRSLVEAEFSLDGLTTKYEIILSEYERA